jgi:hypothetical protein
LKPSSLSRSTTRAGSGTPPAGAVGFEHEIPLPRRNVAGLPAVEPGLQLGKRDAAVGALVGRPLERSRECQSAQRHTRLVARLDPHHRAAVGVARGVPAHLPGTFVLPPRGLCLGVERDARPVGTVDLGARHGLDGEFHHHAVRGEHDGEEREEPHEHRSARQHVRSPHRVFYLHVDPHRTTK